MPFDGATATPSSEAGQENDVETSSRDPYRFLSTRLVRELIAADLRAETAGDDASATAARLLDVVAEGLGQPGAALLAAATLEPVASRGLEAEEQALLRAEPVSGGDPLARRAVEERRVLLLGPGSRDTLLPALREIRPHWTGVVLVPLWDRDQSSGVLVLLSTEATMQAAVLRSLTPALRLLTLLLHPGRHSGLAGSEESAASDPERYLVEIEELRAQLAESRETCQTLQNQESSSQAAQRAESESLRARVAELEAALVAGGNKQFEAFESERTRLTAELEARDARIEALEAEARELADGVRRAEQERDEADARARASSSAAEALREAIAEADTTVDDAQPSIPIPDGEELQLGEIAEAAAAAIGESDPESSDASAPDLEVGDMAGVRSEPDDVRPTLGLWHLDSDPASRAWAGELAARCGASLWTGEGEPPEVTRRLVVMNLFDPSVTRAIELAEAEAEVDSLVYALDAEAGQGFDLGSIGWIRRPLDPAAALRRIQSRVNRRLGGIVIVSAKLRELAGLRQALAEIDAAGSVACDGRQAADLLEIVRRPDAVLIDLALDGGQGLSLARQLRATSETEDVPILFLLPENLQPEQLRADAERARVLSPYATEDARRLVNGVLAHLS